MGSVNVELDPVEKEALIELLNQRLSELSTEIHHTDTAAFRTQLKHLDDTLHHVLWKLTMHEPPLFVHM
jgi:hypothetical protein